jgi:hypothetical protein
MTDTTSEAPHRPTWKAKKQKGAGTGKPAPAVVFNGSNILGSEPTKKWEPKLYTPEMADRVCAWLEDGKSLRSFCLQEGTPKASTVILWTHQDAVFAERYARARDEGADRVAEMVIDALDDPDLPPEQVQRVKSLCDARKWYASKIAPRRYADKLDLRAEVSGPGGGPIQAHLLLDVLLTPANLDRLEDHEVAAIRSAAAKLALPAPVIDALATPMASMASGAGGSAAGELDGDEPSGSAAED